MKEPIFLAIILFRLGDGENSLEDDEHENEDDDFSTSEFRLNRWTECHAVLLILSMANNLSCTPLSGKGLYRGASIR